MLKSIERLVSTSSDICALYQSTEILCYSAAYFEHIGRHSKVTSALHVALADGVRSATSMEERSFELANGRPAALSVGKIGDAADGTATTLVTVTPIDLGEATTPTLSFEEVKDFLEHSPDVFYQTNCDGVVTYMSPTVHNHLGYHPEEIVGKKLADFYMNDQDRLQNLEALQEANGQIVNVESPMRHKDGHAVWASTNARIRFDKENNFVGVEGVTRDITDRIVREDLLRQQKALQEKLIEEADRQAAKAKRASEQKSRFLSRMSHEIRTPLNGILGLSKALSKTSLNGEQQKMLSLVTQSGDALLAVINDILDLARIEAGRLEIANSSTNLRSLVRSTCELHQGAATEKGLTFEIHYDASLNRNYVLDAGRVRQILSNLISNAIKFTERGSLCVTSFATPSEQDPNQFDLCFSVKDTGSGLSDDQKLRVFDEFEQIDEHQTTATEGTGLGLAICKQLVELMGGEISVVSAPGIGSTFHFQVSAPLADDAQDSMGYDETLNSPSAIHSNILIAEDNPINQTVLRTIFAETNATVSFVSDGSEAVEACQRCAYDMVLMDVHMPRLSGTEASKQIRSYEQAQNRPGVPIIALTADIMEHNQQKYKDAGMCAVIAKPIDPEVLLTMIAEFAAQPSE